MLKPIQIGLLGFGNVGSEVYRLITAREGLIKQKTLSKLNVARVCVRQGKKHHDLPKAILTTAFRDVVSDPTISIVVELFGDCPQAREAIVLAIKNGKHVVTANKALMARDGLELFGLAKKHGVQLLFEGSVGGGIPVLRALREGLAANQILTLRGIINGTCNFILTEMEKTRQDFSAILAEAQKLGFAEADPASDVEGHDSASKLCILIMLAFGCYIPVKKIFCEGISGLNALDMQMALDFGYRIKLMGIAKRDTVGQVEARVHPVMVSRSNPIAHVGGAFNAIQYVGDFSGEGMLYGRGAGGKPTASAVVADVIEIAQGLTKSGFRDLSPLGFELGQVSLAQPKKMGALECPYYLRFTVLDKPNVLSQITGLLGRHKISIQHVYQHGKPEEAIPVPVVVFTHRALEANVQKAISAINKLKFVTEDTQVIRIEEDENK